MARRKKKFDPTKNRRLDEFLSKLEIAIEKKEKIMDFVEVYLNSISEKLSKAKDVKKTLPRLSKKNTFLKKPQIYQKHISSNILFNPNTIQ